MSHSCEDSGRAFPNPKEKKWDSKDEKLTEVSNKKKIAADIAGNGKLESIRC